MHLYAVSYQLLLTLIVLLIEAVTDDAETRAELFLWVTVEEILLFHWYCAWQCHHLGDSLETGPVIHLRLQVADLVDANITNRIL